MSDEIQKSEQPNPEEISEAILSFNDPAIITNLFRQLGWSYSLEIQETVTLAKQNANLSIKFKAIKHLRELLREAAETAGYIANVSSTSPNKQGGHTTFSAKRIAGILNPVKQIESTEIKEPQNERSEEPRTESDRGCDRQESQRPGRSQEIQTRILGGTYEYDTREVFPAEDVGEGPTGTPEPADLDGLGGTKSPDGGASPERRQPDRGAEDSGTGGSSKRGTGITEIDGEESKHSGSEKDGGNPCVKTRPPTCDRDLYPGISSAEGT